MELSVKLLENEYWWGGSVANAESMPLSNDSPDYELDMYYGYNQTMPLFISSLGRYIWSEKPLKVKFSHSELFLSSEAEIILGSGGDSLRDAYIAASKKYFPFSGKVPPEKFFDTAQYNTWMEFDYNQNQKDILEYAHSIIENGYTPGILMIDEGWQKHYGIWDFDRAKFPDPKGMIDELHSLGFKVMLWVVPLVNCAGREFFLATEGDDWGMIGGAGGKTYFLRTDEGAPALVKWWNGYSAILNFCREDDREFLAKQLRFLMDEYGADGFKLDGGIIAMYSPTRVINGEQTKYSPDDLNIAWNEFGAAYEYSEYKDTYKGGGKGAVSRLQDRCHSWTHKGIGTILPAALLQGLIGHPFICPDMVGGGEWSNKYLPDFKCDNELFIRMAQLSALFPMIQFSWAPWHALDKENQPLCLAAAQLHRAFGGYIKELVRASAKSGEPILRHLEYEYPHKGYEKINDQFMLGSEILVAPVIQKGQTKRELILPEGKWLFLGNSDLIYEGGKAVTVDAPLNVLPYFIKKGSPLLYTVKI